MKLKCIACNALARPVYYCAAQSPHVVDVEMLQYGLHAHPADLRTRLQERIDAAEGQGYEAVLMVYGLCGRASAGLRARSIPLVFPRAHDCITLFLGSRARYQEQFEKIPGTYWYSQDYIERSDGSGASLSVGTDVDIQSVYDEYVEKYGKDNADYLMEVMGAWQSHYQRAAFIDMGLSDGSAVEAKARDDAARRGWVYERLAGDLVLVRRLLAGDWQADFLVVSPGQTVSMSAGEDVLTCA